MSFGRLTTAQIECGPLRKTQRTTAQTSFLDIIRSHGLTDFTIAYKLYTIYGITHETLYEN
jgi:hypothetical protein